MSDTHEDVRLLLGAYVLGGLGYTDLRGVQDHLPMCATCRDELASLAVLPGLLRRRPPESESRRNLPAPPLLLPALLSRDTVTAGAQASFGAAAGSSTSGHVRLVAKPWGTALIVDLAGLPRSGRFVLQTTGRDGAREQAASWGATTSGAVKVDGATSLTPQDVARVAVVGADGQVVAVATPRA